MIEKDIIVNKLLTFCKTRDVDSFLKVFLINFLFEKINYIERKIGTENALRMLGKYIYNLEKNLKIFVKLNKHHSIYVKYEYNTKQLKYYMIDKYNKLGKVEIDKEKKKKLLMQEFKIMMYKEFEKIINIYSVDGKIVSNGFYIEDSFKRYPEYGGDFSDIIDIFSEVEVCKMINTNLKIKTYIDEKREFYVYSEHFSQINSEVMGYVMLWREFIDDKIFYFAVKNPKSYSKDMMKNFNEKYDYILKSEYQFFLKSKDVFSLLENYILHIKNRINTENNVRYHQDISVIFELMNKKSNVYNNKYLLHNSNNETNLNYKKI